MRSSILFGLAASLEARWRYRGQVYPQGSCFWGQMSGDLSRRSWNYAAPLMCLLLCGTRFWWIAWRYGVNVFVGDQWIHNEPTLFHRQSAWAIFRWESSPWRLGLGGVISAWVEPLFRWNSRYESYIATGVILIACVLTFYLKVRLIGSLTASDYLIPLFVLTPAQYETIVAGPHLSHGSLPFLMLIAFCLAWTVPSPWWKYPAILVVGFFATYTGFGIFVGIISPIALALDLWTHRKRTSHQERSLGIVAIVVALASLFSFFVGYTTTGGTCLPGEGFTTNNPIHYFLFVAFMFANFVGLKVTLALVPSLLLGSAILLFVITICWYAVSKLAWHVVPVILIGYSLLFAAAAAYGRMCLGFAAALGSRYVIYLVPAFLGLYFFSFSVRGRAARVTLILVLTVLGLFSSATIHAADRQQMAAISQQQIMWRSCYLAQHDLVRCNRQTGATKFTYPDTIQKKIDFLESNKLNFFADGATPGN